MSQVQINRGGWNDPPQSSLNACRPSPKTARGISSHGYTFPPAKIKIHITQTSLYAHLIFTSFIDCLTE